MDNKDKLYLIDCMEQFIEELPKHKSNKCFEEISLRFGARSLGFFILSIVDQLDCEHDWEYDDNKLTRHCNNCDKVEETND
jgi:hypothetical protein